MQLPCMAILQCTMTSTSDENYNASTQKPDVVTDATCGETSVPTTLRDTHETDPLDAYQQLCPVSAVQRPLQTATTPLSGAMHVTVLLVTKATPTKTSLMRLGSHRAGAIRSDTPN
jgi:hypothetical protein